MKRAIPQLKSHPYLVSTLLIGGVTLLGLALHNLMGYQVTAFMLLVSVALLAMLYDIGVVVVAAVASALIWDFFFIPPRFTLTIGSTEDRILLLMYFIVALVHAVLTRRIRHAEALARDKKTKADQIRFYNTLLNSLSHELRTPITTILGAADSLAEEKSSLSEDDKKALVRELSSATLRLNQQVENLLGMSRLESGAFVVKQDWVDLHELIYTTLRQLEPEVTKYRVSVFAADALPLVKLDFHLMSQVLYNLVNNVIQHTPVGTDVIIRADYFEGALQLTVSDTGPGFPEGEMQHVFEKFYRLSRSRPGGTGLGLSIVKGFVEAHGGNVSLRNLPLSGAEFTIIIPTEATYINGLKNE